MDKTDLRMERERGHQAKLIIESPIWDESWRLLEESLMDGWARTQTGEVERREQIYALTRLLKSARKGVETVFETGQLAEMQLEAERS